jgi:alpha-galactosidase/6-phospho-beta-glucosidase family protein
VRITVTAQGKESATREGAVQSAAERVARELDRRRLQALGDAHYVISQTRPGRYRAHVSQAARP